MTATKERPISFSAVMSKAIRDNRKTQTRRICKAVPTYNHLGTPIMEWGLSGVYKDDDGRWWLDVQTDVDDCYTEELICPYGNPGDRLYVKEESWRWGRWLKRGKTKTGKDKFLFEPVGNRTVFDRPETTVKRDGSIGWVYRHARFMPRSLSRITLEIVSIRVERLQEITEEDAQAEGFPIPEGLKGMMIVKELDGTVKKSEAIIHDFEALLGFRRLWEALNKDRGYGWEANPWVFVVTFKRID